MTTARIRESCRGSSGARCSPWWTQSLRRCRSGDGAATQSSGSTFTIRWSWLLPTQNVVGVVDLSTNTVRMLVSDGIRYCTAVRIGLPSSPSVLTHRHVREQAHGREVAEDVVREPL